MQSWGTQDRLSCFHYVPYKSGEHRNDSFLYTFSKMEPENRGHIHINSYPLSAEMHSGNTQYLYGFMLLLNVIVTSSSWILHALVSWSWHGQKIFFFFQPQNWLMGSFLSLLCIASSVENEKPLSGQRGNEGLLKAYLWFAVGCVCVWERDSQVLYMYSSMCYVSECVGVGEGIWCVCWQEKSSLFFPPIFSFFSHFCFLKTAHFLSLKHPFVRLHFLF